MTTLSRRAALGLALTAPALLVMPRMAMAREPDVYQTGAVAINGTDPVAYFDQAAPIPGLAEHALDWNGATWQFSNAENRARFEADPTAYAPQFGGYCAWAASRGYVAPTTPEAWTIHDGQLFLNATLGVRRRWLRNIDDNIAKGRANWPGILG